MNLEQRIARRYLTAGAEFLDEALIDKLRKDFLVLVKNVPHVMERVREYDTVVYDEFRSVVKAYATEFHSIIFENFIGRAIRSDEKLSDADAEYIKRTLSKSGWTLYIELRDLPTRIPTASDVERWDKKVRRVAPAFWKDAKSLITWYEQRTKGKARLNKTDRLVLEGFQVDIGGFKENDVGDQEALARLRIALKEYRQKAKKALPWLIQHQLPMFIDFDAKLDEGGKYRAGKDILISPLITYDPGPRAVKTLAHEMAHHLFAHLSEAAEKFWNTAIRQDWTDLEITELLPHWPPNLKWATDFVDAMAFKDPVLALQVDVLAFEHEGPGYQTRADFEARLASGKTTVRVPKTPITAYAGKNTEEAFCEAVGMTVAYGPRAVHALVRHWLDITIPGMVKTAMSARVAERFFVAQELYADYVRAGVADCVDEHVDAQPWLDQLRAQVVATKYLEGKAKAKGLSLLPDFKKALTKFEQGDNEPLVAFCKQIQEILEKKPDWFSAMSTQKKNAINSLYKGVRVLESYITDDMNPSVKVMLQRDMGPWPKWIRTLEIASQLEDAAIEIKRGPFIVIPIPGVTAAQTEGALEALDAAVAKIRPKCPKVLYGKVYLARHLSHGAAAWYVAETDTLSLDITAQKRFDDVFSIIHELGHRHDFQKMLSTKGRNEYWRLSSQKEYEKIHFDAKLRAQMADEVVQMSKLKALGKSMPAPSDTLVTWLKSPHPHANGDVRKLTSAFLKGEIDEKKLHDAVEGKGDVDVLTDKVIREPLYVTPYGKQKGPIENYADGFAHFILGMDMPAELAAILAEELK